jgi:hypothetical protein
MELVDVNLTPVQRRAGVTRVRWSDLTTQQQRRGEPVRALAPGDDVVLHVDGHTFHRGRVLSNVDSGPDGAYLISIGATTGRSFGSPAPRTLEHAVRDTEVGVPGERSGRLSLVR